MINISRFLLGGQRFHAWNCHTNTSEKSGCHDEKRISTDLLLKQCQYIVYDATANLEVEAVPRYACGCSDAVGEGRTGFGTIGVVHRDGTTKW